MLQQKEAKEMDDLIDREIDKIYSEQSKLLTRAPVLHEEHHCQRQG